MKRKNKGSTLDSVLREDGIYEEVASAAIKRVLARQMHTSRAALNRLLDPANESVTLATLQKAAFIVGREIRLELV